MFEIFSFQIKGEMSEIGCEDWHIPTRLLRICFSILSFRLMKIVVERGGGA